jgi:hypothetical protein
MLCEMSRLSLRSVTATATFFAFAVGIVQLLNPQHGSHPPSLHPSLDPTTVLLLQLPLVFYRYMIPKLVAQKWYESVSSFHDCNSLCLWSCPGRNASSIQDSELSCSPIFAQLRPCARLCRYRRLVTQSTGLDNTNSTSREAVVQYPILSSYH